MPEAMALYDKGGVYKRIATLSGASSKAGKLLTRSATSLRKLAAILAIMNGESRVSVGALEAAVAWIEYSEASANTIAATITDRRGHAKSKDDAAMVLTALRALGGDSQPVPARDVQWKTHFDKKRFEAAVRFFTSRPPSPIEVVEQDWAAGNGTIRKRSLLKLAQPPKEAAPITPEEPAQNPGEDASSERPDKPSSPSSFPSEEDPV
jgi:hypothetical protein